MAITGFGDCSYCLYKYTTWNLQTIPHFSYPLFFPIFKRYVNIYLYHSSSSIFPLQIFGLYTVYRRCFCLNRIVFFFFVFTLEKGSNCFEAIKYHSDCCCWQQKLYNTVQRHRLVNLYSTYEFSTSNEDNFS